MPQAIQISVTADQIKAAALSNSLQLLLLPPGAPMRAIVAKAREAFAGPATLSACSMSIGTQEDPEYFFSAFDLIASVSGKQFKGVNTFEIMDFDASTRIFLFVNSVGANLDQLTKGRVDIWFEENRFF